MEHNNSLNMTMFKFTTVNKITNKYGWTITILWWKLIFSMKK